jgi:hypothetical protein
MDKGCVSHVVSNKTQATRSPQAHSQTLSGGPASTSGTRSTASLETSSSPPPLPSPSSSSPAPNPRTPPSLLPSFRRPVLDVRERESRSRSGCRRRRGSRRRPTWPRSRRSWRTRRSGSRTRTRARTCRSTSSPCTRRSSPSPTRPRPPPRQGIALRSNPSLALLHLIRLLCSYDVSFLLCGWGCAEEEGGREGAREGA